MSYISEQKKWIELFNIKLGDKIRIKRLPEHRSNGWACDVNQRMVNWVNDIAIVIGISGDSGLFLRKNENFYWPYFVLEPCPIPNEDFDADKKWFENLTIRDKIVSLTENEARKKGDILYVIETYNRGHIICVNDKMEQICTNKLEEFEPYKEKKSEF